MNTNRFERVCFAFILAIALVLFSFIIQPYMSVLVLVAALAIIFQPLYERLYRLYSQKNIAALSTVFVVILVVFLPLLFLGIRILHEATTIYQSLIAKDGFDVVAVSANFLNAHLRSVHIPAEVLNVNTVIAQGLGWFINNLGLVFSGIGQALFTGLLSIIGLFYFLKDGDRIKQWLFKLIPLASKDEELIVREMKAVLTSVITGTLIIAVIQGIVMGIGFLIFGIPNPAFWGVVTVLFSTIPIIGTWVVVVPAIAYLFLTGQTIAGIGFMLWSVVLINLIYNTMAPQLMRRGNAIHPFIILLSILGGITLFGPIGFLTGPLVAALLFSLLTIYARFIDG
ncbi:MAG: AI-2E family transporter [Candidatus Sungbacteria bacterium]|nr:AI-2E family transporter [Candidatus Sungbacteria bacterium]